MKTLKRLLLLAAVVLVPGLARAQFVPYHDIILAGNPTRPVSGATVTICTAGATGIPCSPTATIYANAAGTPGPIANPTTTDVRGNLNFFIASGSYVASVSGTGLVSYNYAFNVGGGGGGGGVAGSATQVQYNNSGVLAGAAGVTTDGSNLTTKGPIPFTDVTAFGARPVVNVSIPQATATCQSGSAAVTLSAASTFQNGDGITLYNCGATFSLATPGAPTTVPSIATGGTGTGLVANSSTGSSTYLYCVMVRDLVGGLSPCSPTTTITNGLSSLGLSNATITTISRTNDVLTVDTSAPNPAVLGAMVHITGDSNPEFIGWYSITGINTSSEFVIAHTPGDSRSLGSRVGDSNSGTGGNAAFYLSNHLSWTAVTGAWEYYVCAERPGDVSFKLIGQTKPSANGWVENSFDDFGSPFMDSQTYPSYVTNSSCTGTGLNDPLTTTISSGAGTTSITLAATASNNSSTQLAIYDVVPNVKAAVAYMISNGINGPIYFPPITSSQQIYPFTSAYTLSSAINWFISGPISLYETWDLEATENFYGTWSASGVPAFFYMGPGTITAQAANPGIYAHATPYFDHIGINSPSANGGTDIVYQDVVITSMEYVALTTGNGGANTDRLGMSVVIRSESSGGNNFYFDHVLFRGGPDQVPDKSWTPIVWLPRNQNGSGGLLGNQNYLIHCIGCWGSIRGFEEDIAAGSLGYWDMGIYRQGGITPLITITNSTGSVGGFIHLANVFQDTESVSTLALLSLNSGALIPNVDSDVLINASSDTNGPPPPFTGYRVGGTHQMNSNTAKLAPRGSFEVQSACLYEAPYESASLSGASTCSASGLFTASGPMHIPSGQSFWWDSTIPASVASSLTAGGSLSTSTTFQFIVAGVGIDGGETVPSAIPSSGITPTSGNQTISVTFTGQPWFTSYNVYACTASCANTNGTWNPSAVWRWIKNGTSSPISISSLSTGNAPSGFSATGSTVINKNYVAAPFFEAGETTAPTGVAGFDQLYADSTAHQLKMLNNNGTADIVGDAIVENCGATSGGTQNCAKTRQINPLIIFGDVQLNTASTQSITTLPFTSAASYSCTGSDLTTVTGIVSFNTYAAASVTIAESGGVNTDHLRYVCVGF